MRLTKLCLVALLAWSASACSIKFAYNNVDRLVRWQVSDYFDLDARQREYLQAEVESLMTWHRAQHLPQYARFMHTLSDTLSDGVSEAQIEGIFEQLVVWAEEIEAQGMPIAIHILLSLSDEQLAGLPAKLEKSNQELAEDEVDRSVEEIRAHWASEFEDVMERFTGRLGREQRAYIERRAQAYQPEMVLWADYRRRWQADMLGLLEDREDAEAFAADFRALVAARESYYGEVYTRVSEENIRLSREIAAHVLSNLTDKQSERFSDSLRELAEDFEELSKGA